MGHWRNASIMCIARDRSKRARWADIFSSVEQNGRDRRRIICDNSLLINALRRRRRAGAARSGSCRESAEREVGRPSTRHLARPAGAGARCHRRGFRRARRRRVSRRRDRSQQREQRRVRVGRDRARQQVDRAGGGPRRSRARAWRSARGGRPARRRRGIGSCSRCAGTGNVDPQDLHWTVRPACSARSRRVERHPGQIRVNFSLTRDSADWPALRIALLHH